MALKVALSHRAPANPSHTAQVIKTFSACLPAPHTTLTEVAYAAAGKHSPGTEVWGATAPCGQLPHVQADGKEKTEPAGRATSLPPLPLTPGTTGLVAPGGSGHTQVSEHSDRTGSTEVGGGKESRDKGAHQPPPKNNHNHNPCHLPGPSQGTDSTLAPENPKRLGRAGMGAPSVQQMTKVETNGTSPAVTQHKSVLPCEGL